MSDEILRRGPSGNVPRMLVSGSAWTLGGRLARTVLGLVGIAILARLLDPAEFGVVAITVAAIGFAIAVLEGFIDLPAIRHDDLTREALRSLIWAALAVGTGLATILWFAAPAIQQAMDFPHLSTALRMTLPVVLAQIVLVTGSSILRRQHRFREAVIVAVGQMLFYTAAAVGFAWHGLGLWSILLAQTASALLSALIVARLADLPLCPPRRFSFSEAGRTSSYGALSGLLAWGYTNVDTLVVGATLGPVATGLYSRAYNISVQFKEPFAAIDQTLRHALASIKDRAGQFDGEVIRLLMLATLISATFAAAAAAAAADIVRLLLGERFGSAAPILAILMFGFPMRIVNMIVDAATISGGRMQHLTARNALLFVIVVAGAVLAAPHGTIAVAWVVSGAIWLGALMSMLLYARARRLPAWRLPAALVPGLLAAVLLVAFLAATRDHLGAPLLLRLTYVGASLVVFNAVVLASLPAEWLPSWMVRLRQRVRTGMRLRRRCKR